MRVPRHRPFPGERVGSGHETNKLGNDSPSSFSLFSFLAYNTANPPPTTISARDVHEMGWRNKSTSRENMNGVAPHSQCWLYLCVLSSGRQVVSFPDHSFHARQKNGFVNCLFHFCSSVLNAGALLFSNFNNWRWHSTLHANDLLAKWTLIRQP